MPAYRRLRKNAPVRERYITRPLRIPRRGQLMSTPDAAAHNVRSPHNAYTRVAMSTSVAAALRISLSSGSLHHVKIHNYVTQQVLHFDTHCRWFHAHGHWPWAAEGVSEVL
jgi:hypothetical protein